jgi:hypothetical protein
MTNITRAVVGGPRDGTTFTTSIINNVWLVPQVPKEPNTVMMEIFEYRVVELKSEHMPQALSVWAPKTWTIDMIVDHIRAGAT